MFFDVESYFAGIVPDRGIVWPPPGRRSSRKITTPGFALGLGKGIAPNLQITIWEMPRDKDRVGSRFTGGECACKQNRTAISSPGIDIVGAVVGSECPG